MNAIKGRLKVALLVVGVLVVGLGMYTAFQVQEVEANNSSASCFLKSHISFVLQYTVLSRFSTGATQKVKTICTDCWAFYPPHDHTYKQYIENRYEQRDYDHKWPGQFWEPCHLHAGTVFVSKWEIQNCGHTGFGGGG